MTQHPIDGEYYWVQMDYRDHRYLFLCIWKDFGQVFAEVSEQGTSWYGSLSSVVSFEHIQKPEVQQP